MNGMAKILVITIPLLLALVTAIVGNDQLGRTRDTHLQHDITRVELKQTEQYGSIQTSLVRIETKLGIGE